MRPIKFRAWDKFEKKMIHNPIIDGENGKMMGFNLLDGSFSRRYSDDEITLMQYTGLTDKNGRDIYEGDIVRDAADFLMQIKHGEFTYSLIDDTEKEWLLPFVGFYAEGIPDGIIDDTSVIGASELVGNIYEHPHLLEGD